MKKTNVIILVTIVNKANGRQLSYFIVTLSGIPSGSKSIKMLSHMCGYNLSSLIYCWHQSDLNFGHYFNVTLRFENLLVYDRNIFGSFSEKYTREK